MQGIKIIEITSDKWTKIEGFSSKGLRVKSWYERIDDNEVFLYKEPKIYNYEDGSFVTKEIWTELIAYKIGTFIGLNIPEAIPAVLENNYGILIRNFLERGLAGMPINELIEARANNQRYRYYVSLAVLKNIPERVGTVSKVSGNEIESAIRKLVSRFLKDEQVILSYLRKLPITKQNKILKMLQKLEVNDRIIRLILNKVMIYKDHLEWSLKKNVLLSLLENLVENEELMVNLNVEDSEMIEFRHDIVIAQTKKMGNKIILWNDTFFNETLIQAIVKAFYYHDLREKKLLSRKESDNSYVRRIMNLRFLSPKLIEEILYGKQEPNLKVVDLFKMVKI